MHKIEKVTKTSLLTAVLTAAFFLLSASFSQATLTVFGDQNSPTQWPLIGLGQKTTPNTVTIPDKNDWQDFEENVQYLLNEFYDPDVDLMGIGKVERDWDDDTFTSPATRVEWNPLFDSLVLDGSGDGIDGTFWDASTGTGALTSTFDWTGRIWYSIKAGNGFALYDTGLTGLVAGQTHVINFDITDWAGQNGLSHFRLWTETSPVPEPATILLFGAGLAGMLGFRQRRKTR